MRPAVIRVTHLVVVLLIVSIGTFFLLELVPGDPAVSVLGSDATPDQYAAMRQTLGLDRSLLSRLLQWLGGVLHGDLGSTLIPPVGPVSDRVMSSLPVSLELTGLATVMALAAAIPLAMVSARRHGERADRVLSALSYALLSIPSFLAALLLIFFFVFRPDVVRLATTGLLAVAAALVAIASGRAGRRQGWPVALALGLLAVVLFRWWPSFPRQGFVRLTSGEPLIENLRSIFLPALSLSLLQGAVFMRLLRGDMLTTLQEDYVLAARATGRPMWQILVKDVLRPSSLSMVTVAGVMLGRSLGGAVVIEIIFRLPGLGSLIVGGVGSHDYPLVQGAVLAIAVLFVLLNLATDALYVVLDPRIRRSEARR